MAEEDTYVDLKIVGHEWIRLFYNKDKIKGNHPDYKANGVAIWIRKIRKDDKKPNPVANE